MSDEAQPGGRPAVATTLGDEGLALVEQLRAALQPLRQDTNAFPFAVASDEANFTCCLTKAQIVAANEAILAADRALELPADAGPARAQE